MENELTCKDCKAFVLEEEEKVEGAMPGVCILNPPQMIVGSEAAVDGSSEQVVMSAFPKVDGLYTRCMKLILLSGLVLLSSCAPRANLGGRSIMGHAWSNFVNRAQYENSPAYYRDHIVCRTRRDYSGHIVTKCD